MQLLMLMVAVVQIQYQSVNTLDHNTAVYKINIYDSLFTMDSYLISSAIQGKQMVATTAKWDVMHHIEY